MKYYKGYYMITSRCNLACSYCVLENSKDQLKRELPLSQKKQLIKHLYEKFNFRSITLSGGEPILIGKKKGVDFLDLINYLGQFKSEDKTKNLYIHLYTNALLLTSEIVDKMKGIVDEVSINIDGFSDDILKEVGRSVGKNNFLTNFVNSITLLNKNKIQVKLHTVVSKPNVSLISKEVISIYNIIKENNINLNVWKFYQYMSYDSAEIDKKHIIETYEFNNVKNEIIKNIGHNNVKLHFKDNIEMNNSLFNILPYGNAQFMLNNDSWSTSKRTDLLTNYDSLEELFEKNSINKELFEKFHSITI